MDYYELNMQLRSLLEGVPHRVANMANAASLIFNTLDRLNWAGFYELEGERLVLGPFMGMPACIEIPLGKGVCGVAAKENRTVVVENVHDFPGHIPCDCASNSEIVIPLRRDGRVFGVLDIDSPVFGRFTEEDRLGLEEAAAIIEKAI